MNILSICILLTMNLLASFSVETTFMSERDGKAFYNSADIVQIQDFDMVNPIESFDVRVDGTIALITDEVDDKKIYIFNKSFQAEKCFSFESFGNCYAFWEQHNIVLFFERSQVLLTINENGEYVNCVSVSESPENERYLNELRTTTEKTINGNTFILRNDMGVLSFLSSSYSQLVISDSKGNETIIYDANIFVLRKKIFFILIIIGIIVGAVIVILRARKKLVKALSQ